MGNCQPNAQTKRSREITREQAKTKRKFDKEVRLLLLGPGESGKSTFFKQMKIIQNAGKYPESERKRYDNAIFVNCMTEMKVLIQASLSLKIPLEPKNENSARTLLQMTAGSDYWSIQVAQMIKALWADKGIKRTYEKRDMEFQLNDSAAYFFDNIDRYMADDFVPSIADILRTRVRTTGIEEAQFQIEDFKFRLVDVGGQRCERRKWIHCFEGSVITAIIFCAGLSEYDQFLREKPTVNRMHESLKLFTELANSAWFSKTPFIIFLNKLDLFKEKIQKVDMTKCFPGYTGGKNFDKAAAFIKARFIERNHSPHNIYTHLTCALDTGNVKVIFKVVKETVINGIINSTFAWDDL